VAKTTATVKDFASEDIRHLVEELQIHRIELEIQNDELRRAQLELEAERDRHANLFDISPVGYLTLSEKGLILEANLTGAGMLGVERSYLLGKPLTGYITRDTQDAYYLHRSMLFETKSQQTCELKLVKKTVRNFMLACKVSWWKMPQATSTRFERYLPI